MKAKICVLPGDGIGPEVTTEAVKVLRAVADRFNHDFCIEYALIGASAIQATGVPLPEDTLSLCRAADAVLFGTVGDPAYDNEPNALLRPEQGLLKLRKELGLYANIRPVKCYDALLSYIPLRPEKAKGADMVFFRELTGGIYFGEKGRQDNNKSAYDQCSYTKEEIVRIAKLAYHTAMKRSRRLTLVDKANVLETSRLWRETTMELSKSYPEVKTNYLFVDNAAMQLILDPSQFDVILTENMFGDILTDEASVITGSLGLLPSASIGDKHALYEPIHGSYPQAAGKGIANPIGSILSVAMMLEHSFNLQVESAYIYKAVNDSIEDGFLTNDLQKHCPRSTGQVGDRVAKQVFEEIFELV